MDEHGLLRQIEPQDREPGDPTPGMVREVAIQSGTLWSGHVTTEPHMVSGWHHHGEYETSIYLVDGGMRLEFGPGGQDVIDAGPGDFVHVPPYAVHREGNPTDSPAHAVVTRSGTGPPTVNVDGPEPA